MGFPSVSLLDNFNRVGGLGANWSQDAIGAGSANLTCNGTQCGTNNGPYCEDYWSAASFTDYVEAAVTIAQRSSAGSGGMRILQSAGSGAADGYCIEWHGVSHPVDPDQIKLTYMADAAEVDMNSTTHTIVAGKQYGLRYDNVENYLLMYEDGVAILGVDIDGAGAPGYNGPFHVSLWGYTGGGTAWQYDNFYVGEGVVPGAFSLVAFRGRKDNGDQTNATWIAPQNEGFIQDEDDKHRMRFEVQETSGFGLSVPFSGQLVSSLNGGAWTAVSTTSSVIKSVSSGIVGNGTATTDQLTAGTGTFRPGTVDSNDGIAVTGAAFGANEHTELEFIVQFVPTDLVIGDIVELRLRESTGPDLDVYAVTAAVEIVGTNCFSNPGVEPAGTTGWTSVSSTIARVTSELHGGLASLQVDTTAAAQGVYANALITTTSNALDFSCWVKAPVGKAMLVEFAEYTFPGGVFVGKTSDPFVGTGAWQRRTLSRTFNDVSESSSMRGYVLADSSGSATFYVDDFWGGEAPAPPSQALYPDADIDATGWVSLLEQATHDSTQLVGGTSVLRLAQPFVGGTLVTAASYWAEKVGTPPSDLIVEIQTDSSGAPSGTSAGDSRHPHTSGGCGELDEGLRVGTEHRLDRRRDLLARVPNVIDRCRQLLPDRVRDGEHPGGTPVQPLHERFNLERGNGIFSGSQAGARAALVDDRGDGP